MQEIFRNVNTLTQRILYIKFERNPREKKFSPKNFIRHTPYEIFSVEIFFSQISFKFYGEVPMGVGNKATEFGF